ncbi:hypothetical protein ANANG_G00183260 [Anguilla anguilla]|uniref:Thyroid hormone receptor associated protein 3b n=1 Tax=Anguilla anguilla TaxID=7936 RepID=A0A9D3M5M9_ANGAN|nr:hypothetical protein ANANG_G00183260 [Anguilla anguilla]
MSKDPKSPSRSRSRSASRSRSPSRSRSQSRSRSRSRKRRYSSRSRSRSHSRDRGYPREYQNNRGFRGYNRGFRRPYYYRGRNRGFYPRGRYQRGAGAAAAAVEAAAAEATVGTGPTTGTAGRRISTSITSTAPGGGLSLPPGPGPGADLEALPRPGPAAPTPPRPAPVSAPPLGLGQARGEGGAEGRAKDGGGADKQDGTWQGLTDYSASPKQASPQMRSAVIGSAPSGFGFFSKEGVKTGDRTALSSAFQKFLVERKEKQQASQLDQELTVTGEERGNSITKSLFPIKGASFPKGPPFSRSEGTAPEPGPKPHGAKRKSKATRDLYGQWEEPEPRSPAEGRGHRAVDSGDDDMAEEGLSRGRARGLTPRSLARDRGADRRGGHAPCQELREEGEEFDFSVNLGRSGRPGTRDPGGRDSEFRPVFQSARLCHSPSELFARHIVSIVHQIKAQHFQCSGLTLNERFAMYQRRAAEEGTRARKSPEIHRRIDISPSAFKKHSYLFEEMENCRASVYKDPLRKTKDDLVDLQFEQKHRKKRSSKERDHRWAGGRESGDSRGSSQERTAEKSSKRHKKSKKSKKKRERSRSSSVASPRSNRAGDYPGEEPIEEGFSKAPLGPRDHGGPMERGPARGGFSRIGGRGWNKISYPGHNSGPMAGVPLRPPEEEWDPEYTPKSNKYFLHDVREGEKWLDGRGRGRGIALPGRGRFVPRSGSPKWVHDKFQGGREEGELLESEQDPEEGEGRKGGAPSKL